MSYFNLKKMALIGLAFSLVSCAGPTVSYKVTRPSQLPVKDVEMVSVGKFQDVKGENIALPKMPKDKAIKGKSTLFPAIKSFRSNSDASDIVRGLIIASVSTSGQYKILNTSDKYSYSGVIPNAKAVGVINAKVKYFEFSDHKSEKVPYMMLATKEGLPMDQMILVEGAKFAARKLLSDKAKKDDSKIGVFLQRTPYVEKIAAMEVSFDFIRKGTGKKIVDTQTFRSYYVKKWGGKSDTSHLPLDLKNVIVDTYQKDQSLLSTAMSGADKVKLAASDPDEFLAQGGNLLNNSAVPATNLAIKMRLASDIVQQYLKKISSYSEDTTLEIDEAGDAVAVNYLKGNAYEEAINRIEALSDKTAADRYNLALAYESVGEAEQAAKYYMIAMDDAPDNKVYRNALAELLEWVTDPNNVPAVQTYREALERLKN